MDHIASAVRSNGWLLGGRSPVAKHNGYVGAGPEPAIFAPKRFLFHNMFDDPLPAG
jgi:hypothetical protein